MKLKEYLDKEKVRAQTFAERIGVSTSSIYNIINERNDARISLIVKIIDETKGEVSFRDLVPEIFMSMIKKTID